MIISKTLIDWYSNNKRDLPWRQTTAPYYIWLSEIILQQTQVNQGLPYYEAFVKSYPDIFALASADERDILKLWQGLGYYSRARNLHATSRYIVSEFNGIFPNNYSDLLKLKGVGDYTASAIASICYNEVSAVVDGNVYRVLSRYYEIDTPINSSKGIKEFKQLAQQLIDKKNPSDFNQAIMEFGAIQCKPKNPNCNTCPLKNSCMALQKNKIDKLPVKLKKIKVKKKYFNFLVFISKDNTTILEKRLGNGIWQNLYQFPLIETTKSINYQEIERLLKNHDLVKGVAYNLSLYNKDAVIHKLSHQHLHTKFWIVNVNNLNVKGIPFHSIYDYAVPVLINNFIKAFNF